MRVLRGQYNERCFQGCYVLSVESIVQASPIRICPGNLSGEGYVEVQWRARVRQSAAGDLALIRLQTLAPLVSGLDGNLYAALQGAPASAPLAVGMAVPVRLIKALHSPMRPVISAVAVIHTAGAPLRLTARGRVGPEARGELAPLRAAVDEELRLRSGLPRESLMFFETLLYGYSAGPAGEPTTVAAGGTAAPAGGTAVPAWEGPPSVGAGAPVLNLLSHIDAALVSPQASEGEWSRPLSIYRSSPLVVRSAAQRHPENNTVAQPAREVMFALLRDMWEALVIVRRLAEEFTDPQSIRQNMAVWQLMRKSQELRPAD